MADSIITYLKFAFLLAICCGMVWLLVEPIIWWTPYSEVRLCVRFFLVMFAVNTFAVLRLYNSIVQNTRFSIKLREVFIKLHQAIPGLERSFRNVNSSLGNVKSSMDILKKSIDSESSSLEEAVKELKKK